MLKKVRYHKFHTLSYSNRDVILPEIAGFPAAPLQPARVVEKRGINKNSKIIQKQMMLASLRR